MDWAGGGAPQETHQDHGAFPVAWRGHGGSHTGDGAKGNGNGDDHATTIPNMFVYGLFSSKQFVVMHRSPCFSREADRGDTSVTVSVGCEHVIFQPRFVIVDL